MSNEFMYALKTYTKPHTQKQIASALGVSRSAVSMWLCGARLPLPAQVSEIIKMCSSDPGADLALKEAWIKTFRSLRVNRRTEVLSMYELSEPLTDEELIKVF